MKRYKTICLDLDGTVYKGSEPIRESVDFLKSLQADGIKPYFITNNSSHTRAEVVRKLGGFGIKTSETHVMTSAIAAADFCAQQFSGFTVQLIGEAGLKEALHEAGLKLTDSRGDVVVMGIDRSITYGKLAQACLSIRAGAKFVATNGDLAVPGEEGLVPGNGAFVELVKASTGSDPVIVGKPEPYMLDYIRRQSGARKEEMIMIGDNYDTDILSGIRYGIDTIHLEGGVTSREQLLAKTDTPTYAFRTLAEWKDQLDG
ncbi:acid sugar phosphatase [Sporosarcina sp. NCCP-2716]|uniref:TIGR01457 family HAD-type hydrolase n=1 Tax=Sporosarcina sp. NCCP-2716 TaxID=2943679 RepID=UPI00203D620A|nr:TIGR01457 family HAD-type hydrolase [Sporosarcina sp. NCCP-2716]GKV69984.1 acid sugar phosphatase [Sporosarcina sp. NCCP-2716]